MKKKMNTVWWIVKIDLNKFLLNENRTTALRDGGFYEYEEIRQLTTIISYRI